MKWKDRLAEIEALKAKHKQRPINKLPDLTVKQTYPSLSATGVAQIVDKPQSGEAKAPPGFVVGHPHKQGMQVMPISELQWAGGKKS